LLIALTGRIVEYEERNFIVLSLRTKEGSIMQFEKLKYIKILLLILVIIIFTVGCSTQGTTTSTTSDILVKEKGYSEDFTEAWIIVVNPNDTSTKGEFKIVVEEPMVWNLIEENKIYFSSYKKEAEKDRVLIQIKNIGDDDTLR
jgi:hypothetical protein